MKKQINIGTYYQCFSTNFIGNPAIQDWDFNIIDLDKDFEKSFKNIGRGEFYNIDINGDTLEDLEEEDLNKLMEAYVKFFNNCELKDEYKSVFKNDFQNILYIENIGILPKYNYNLIGKVIGDIFERFAQKSTLIIINPTLLNVTVENNNISIESKEGTLREIKTFEDKNKKLFGYLGFTEIDGYYLFDCINFSEELIDELYL